MRWTTSIRLHAMRVMPLFAVALVMLRATGNRWD
jgi:hypothetical protein